MRFILSALLFLMFSHTALSQRVNNNEVPFELLPSGHILLNATVDGVAGRFIFDTGAGLTAFTKTFFEKLKHVVPEQGGYTGFRATGERIDLNLYKVNNFELGSFKKQEEEISWLDVNLGGIDGIISLKLLEAQPFTIDFTKKVIVLQSAQTLVAAKKGTKRIPVQLEQSRNKALSLFAYFTVNNSLILQIALDSGAGKDVYRLSSKYLKQLNVNVNDTLNVKKIEKKSEINTEHSSLIYLTKLKSISAAGNATINTSNFPVQFVDGLIYDGIMWINWLGSKITFDLNAKALFVK